MMIDKIKRTREEASLINKAALLENDFETMKYDQIFSLLGGRGAGKTSMLLTIYNELKTNDENILLPIIMPELIDEDEDILSWLLSAMKINLISVRRTSNYTASKGIYTDTTKTKKSQRSLKFPQSVMDLLREYKDEQDEERIKLGTKWQDYDRLFVKWDGRPMNNNTPYF